MLLLRTFLVLALLAAYGTVSASRTAMSPCPTTAELECLDIAAAIDRMRKSGEATFAPHAERGGEDTALRDLVIRGFAQEGLQAEILSLIWHGRPAAITHDWQLRLRPIAIAIGRRFSMLAEIRAPHDKNATTSALLVMRVHAEVLVATNRIARQTGVTCASFRRERVDLAALSKPIVVVGCQTGTALHVKRYLGAGDALHADDVGEPYAVVDQEPVRIRVSAGRVTLESGGIALASARIGEMVTVRPNHSTQTVKGRVLEPKLVVLEDNGS